MKGQNLKGDRPTHVENGCSLHDNCETCPFPDCMIGNKRSILTLKAKKQALELWEKGYSPREIAKGLGKSIKTIYRWLELPT